MRTECDILCGVEATRGVAETDNRQQTTERNKTMKKNNENHKAWSVDMTSCAKILEVNNSMCHNFYFLAKVRVWTGRNTFFRRRFVVWFDSEDLCEYFSEDHKRITQKDIKDYAKEQAWNFVEGNLLNKGDCTYETMKPFTDECIATIRRFNGLAA